ncbi:MAG: TolC family protein, partial [Muribaculaceae bacterium]|nr:TolC family protein [Muribaculaceae bacterium]
MTAQQDTSAVVTLDDCLRIALSESPTVRVADMEVKRVDYSKKETLGQLLPSISFGATYNRMLAKQVMYMNMDGFGGMGGSGDKGEGSETEQAAESSRKSSNGGIKVGLDNSYSTGFTASMPLIAPQLWQTMKLSDSQILRSVELARSSRLELVNQVKSAYYTLLLAEDSRRVIEESYEMAKLNYDIYNKKYEAGAASDYDVLRTSVAMKNIEPELMQSEVSIKQARLQLLILMGLDASTPIVTADGLSAYEATMYETVLNAGRDYSQNSSLKLNDIDTKIARRNVSIQQAAWYPTLALSANYNWTSMSNGSPL